MDNLSLQITSEIGRLKRVMLHKPSWELERITPKDLNDVLFEDIPWLKKMRQEHDGFADALKNNGAEIIYLEDCLQVILKNHEAKVYLINDILENEVKYDKSTSQALYDFLIDTDHIMLSKYILGGVSKNDIDINQHSLIKYMPEDYAYYFAPLPNLYFMRDPAVIIGNGILLSVMENMIRRRESSIMRALYRYHELFKNAPLYYDNTLEKMSIEGGDVLILSQDTVCVGCSQRTSAYAIEKFAQNLLNQNESFNNVIAVQIPHLRSFMHLDTVLTMVDADKFIIYPGIMDMLKVVSITRSKKGGVKLIQQEKITHAFKKALHLDSILFINSGGDNPVTSAREQWNDSTNTLAIAPGVVITYNRNEVTNEILHKNGVKVLEIEGGELVRGRGGPRCMSMPIYREKI